MTLPQNESFRPVILIVDDVPTNIHALVNILRDRYATIAATSGEKALKIAQTTPRIDLILLDIKMPGMDGYAVLNHLKERPETVHIPVMFVTSLDDNADVALGLKLGVVDYLIKPIDPTLLLQRLEQHFEWRQSAVPVAGSLNTQARRKKKILIVDDMPANVHELIESLKDDYQIRVANTGAAALAMIEEESPPDLMLLDIKMPGMDGYEVCRRLKATERGKQITVIFVTVSGVVEEKVQGFEVGAVDYIVKPYDIAEVKARINNQLELAALRHHLELLVEHRTSQLKASEEKFRTVADFTADWETWVGKDGNLIYVSPSCERLTGYRSDEFMTDPTLMNRIIYSEDHPAVHDRCSSCAIKRTLQQPHTELEFRVIKKNGEVRWIEHHCQIVLREDGSSLGCRTSNRDITARKKVEEELRLYALVLENSSEGMLVTDSNNLIMAINPAFTQLTGYTYEEVLGQNPSMFKSGRHDVAFYREMWHDLNTTGQWQGEIWDKHKLGHVHAKSLTINTILNEEGKVHRYVALFTDITEKKKAEELIWQQANYDALTKLPNRRLFRDRLQQELIKAERMGYQLAVLLIDLDEFKEVNDTLGHDYGDLLLQEAASRLNLFIQPQDILSRLGGDEFVIMLSGLTGRTHVEDIAQAIVNKLAEPFMIDGEEIYISASIGITLCPEDANKIDTLLKHADQAMYQSKKLGRNRFSYFTPALQELAQKRLHMAKELRAALAAEQFQLYYQPVVELASGRIGKVEALLRWNHPEQGMISPAEFIPLAEEIGTIVEIGHWVFEQAARQVKDWRERIDGSFQIAVNRSPVQFRQEKNSTFCTQFMRDLGLPGEAVVLEITEGLLLDAQPSVSASLNGLREYGVQMSIDDFGTGYSSLSYLRKFPIDYLKIDKSFVEHLAPESSNLALCEAIIVMAHKLGIKVVAEGIETEAQRELLLGMGCDYGQGFLFCRPQPAEVVEQLLTTQA